jgi:acetoacetyl-CoA synthetase
VAPLQPDDNFFDVGGTSLAAVQVFQEIHDRMGVELPLSTLVYAQTTEELAAVIDGPGGLSVPPLVLLRPGTEGLPLFITHGISGDILQLRTLALRLRTDRPVFGIQARGLNPGEQPHARVEEMADAYVDTIRSIQPRGPYFLVGHSFGGLIAFEMARRLTDMGERVELLGLVDASFHHRCLPLPSRLVFLASRHLRYVRAGLDPPETRLSRYLRRISRRPAPPPPEPVMPPVHRYVDQLGWEAFRAYRPAPYDGSAVLFFAEVRDPELFNPLPVWTRLVRGGLTVENISGGHVDAIAEPHVRVLAERLDAHLGRSDTATPQ